ncbi:MAG: VWA domain-containing protein [Polynucleobacter sp.]|nr:MAG: VWA domain-containing protein [Polynucleobacter sp.]
MNPSGAPKYDQEVVGTVPDPKSLSPKGLENLKSIYQNHLENKKPLFKKYAGKHAPSFRFSTDGSVKTAMFKVGQNGTSPEVVIGLDFFAENNLSMTQAEWVMMHELTHFKDFDSDHENYLKNFERAKNLGQELTDKLANAYKQKYGEDLPESRKMSLTHRLGEMYSSGYFNVVDDIWVNHTVEGEPTFAKGTSGDSEREKLYTKVLSPSKNLSYHDFESYQFLYAMLRGENVDEGFRVTENAQSALGKDYKIMGKEVNTQDIIDTYLNPQKKDKKLGIKATDTKTRHQMLSLTLLPTYTELLFNDVLRELDKYHDDPTKDMDKVLDEILKLFEKMFPDFIPHEVIEQWGKYSKEMEGKEAESGKDKKPDAVDPKKVAQEKIDKQAKDWRQENNIEEDLHSHIKDVEKDIAPYISSLDELWRAISTGVSLERRKSSGGLYKTGNQVNLPSFIRQFPKVVQGQVDRLHVMERSEMVEQSTNKPERIEVSLILDRSGSMFQDGGMGSSKNKAVERVALLVMKSLERFNQFVDSTREETKTKLFADTEVILYGTHAKLKKPFRKSSSLGKDRVEQYHVMASLAENYRQNNEEEALAIINDSTTLETEENIAHKKLLKIAFLITDGGTNPSPEILSQISELEKKGVHVHALQIGDVSEEEIELFTSTWNDGRATPLGYLIGDDLSQLAPVITEMLKEELGDVEI